MSEHKKAKMNAITEARDQLQGALEAAGSRKRDSEWDSSDDDNLIDIQDVSSPSRVVRKRRRRETPVGSYHDTYVMKLFDRSVNLAQFGPSTALYPVCRAWMANDPTNTSLAAPKREPVEEHPEPAAESGLVFRLPAPVFAPLDESGHPADLRLPADLQPPAAAVRPAELHPSKAEDAPHKTSLLADHLSRWRGVRDRWHAAAARNELRYAESFRLLKSICVPDS
ncbi:protein lin-37 homolog isoform X2 [Pollicipes pollicipes]|uniref:protein lin-37 homolog isoform X2 n=1 Tax=Pollicipes pollicipes TaxID=41117 RepID=UPI0018852779|nr:protein lin-37 homolog isoform X2 [Pollicipes pollicipes]